MPRSGFRAIQDAVHRDERLAVGYTVWRKDAIRGQAVMQAESDEKGLAYRVPVRQASLVVLHLHRCAFGAGIFSGTAA